MPDELEMLRRQVAELNERNRLLTERLRYLEPTEEEVVAIRWFAVETLHGAISPKYTRAMVSLRRKLCPTKDDWATMLVQNETG
jgi:hypothetical protein